MIQFIVTATLILGSCTVIIIDTKSVYLGIALATMMVIQWDQGKRVKALGLVVRKLWIDAKYGRKGVSL